MSEPPALAGGQFQSYKVGYFLCWLVAERHTFGTDYGIGNVFDPRLKTVIAKDKVIDHTAFELFTARVVGFVERVQIIDRDSMIFYSHMEGTGHLLDLVADLLHLDELIWEPELPTQSDLDDRLRLAVLGNAGLTLDLI